MTDLWVALVHHPVLNRERSVITTAVTNLDIHDIARASRTYGVRGYFVVTPIEKQRELVRAIKEHWVEGHGATRVPERAEAMKLVETIPSLGEAFDSVTESAGRKPTVVATCARPGRASVSFPALRERIGGGEPILLLFGTGWGLADEALEAADEVLDPVVVQGSDYNHLSVRTAVAIILDRLLG